MVLCGVPVAAMAIPAAIWGPYAYIRRHCRGRD